MYDTMSSLEEGNDEKYTLYFSTMLVQKGTLKQLMLSASALKHIYCSFRPAFDGSWFSISAITVLCFSNHT